MKNTNTARGNRGASRIAELYGHESLNSLMENRRVLVFCQASKPIYGEGPQDLSQALRDNCTMRIVFTSEGVSLTPVGQGSDHD